MVLSEKETMRIAKLNNGNLIPDGYKKMLENGEIKKENIILFGGNK